MPKMELLLNVTWMLMVVALFISARRQRHGKRSVHAGLGLSIVGLTCVAILMFPVVSVSDDMCIRMAASPDFAASKADPVINNHQHSKLFVASSRNISRRMMRLDLVGTHGQSVKALLCCLTILNVFEMPQRSFEPATARPQNLRPLDGFVHIDAGRAPPAVSL
jgi:hypothetical protein